MDVREMAIWHSGAKLLLIERTILNLFHLRVAQFAEHGTYEKEIERLEERKESLLNGNKVKSPKTPEECRQARLEFAKMIGLRVEDKKGVKDGI